MKRKDLTSILLWAGLILLAVLLIVGCAKKAPVIEEVPPPPPPPDTVGQAAREAAEREAAERARLEAEEKARLAAEQAAKASLQIIYFDFDKYNLRPDAREAAQLDAGILQEYSNWKVLIEGHCDEWGTEEYNLALGERRANTVQTFFINYGLDPGRFSTVSYGESRPADPGHNKEAWQKNRRAVLVIK